MVVLGNEFEMDIALFRFKLGGAVTLAPFELRPGRRVAQVADPDGNMIELGQG